MHSEGKRTNRDFKRVKKLREVSQNRLYDTYNYCSHNRTHSTDIFLPFKADFANL